MRNRVTFLATDRRNPLRFILRTGFLVSVDCNPTPGDHQISFQFEGTATFRLPFYQSDKSDVEKIAGMMFSGNLSESTFKFAEYDVSIKIQSDQN